MKYDQRFFNSFDTGWASISIISVSSLAMAKEDGFVGTIENVVGDSRLVDKGIVELSKFSRNAPTFDPERRRFLKHVAVLAGLIASGQLNISCATAQEPVTYQGKTYSDWEAYLLTQDWIRGPKLLIHPSTGLPSDFEHHIKQGWNKGFGGIDYDVPIGTPIVPTADTFRTRTKYHRSGGNELFLVHRHKPRLPLVSWYTHLDKYADIISDGKLVARVGGAEIKDQELDKLKIVAFSGMTGSFTIRHGIPHLHFQITEVQGGGQIGQGIQISPGLDPFQYGIDVNKPFDEYAGKRVARPVYWDGKTEIPLQVNRRKKLLQQSSDTLDKRVRESDLDKETKDELLKRNNNPEALRDYLGMLVLTKHAGKDGKLNYRHLPGSKPYAWMLEIFSRTSNQELIAMLPFISPFVKEAYQQANPGVKF
jgi:hypothetical protein